MSGNPLAQKKNAAGRLLNIFIRFNNTRDGKADEQAHVTWARALKLDMSTHETERIHQISDFLGHCRDEVTAMEVQALDAGIPEPSVRQYCSRYKSALAPDSIRVRRDGIANQLTAENLLFLEWCAFCSAEDQKGFSEEEAAKLITLLNEADELLAGGTLPEFTRKLVAKHVSSIRAALNESLVRGVEPLSDAIAAGIMQFELKSQALKDDLSHAEQSKYQTKLGTTVGAVFKQGATMAGDIDKYAKLLQHGNTLADKVMGLLS